MENIEILLIDDDPIAGFLLNHALKNLGIPYTLVIKKNGKVAMDFLCEKVLRGDKDPDLVLLDYNMPVMDGVEFLEHYKKILLPANPLKIVAFAIEDIRKRALFEEQGITTFLSKPIDEEKIKHFLENKFK